MDSKTGGSSKSSGKSNNSMKGKADGCCSQPTRYSHIGATMKISCKTIKNGQVIRST